MNILTFIVNNATFAVEANNVKTITKDYKIEKSPSNFGDKEITNIYDTIVRVIDLEKYLFGQSIKHSEQLSLIVCELNGTYIAFEVNGTINLINEKLQVVSDDGTVISERSKVSKYIKHYNILIQLLDIENMIKEMYDD